MPNDEYQNFLNDLFAEKTIPNKELDFTNPYKYPKNYGITPADERKMMVLERKFFQNYRNIIWNNVYKIDLMSLKK